jgi:hypothetical protein
MQYEENEMFRKGIFQVEIVNSNSEILTLFCHFSSKNETIYYPMIAEYEGITFNCQDFILSNYFTNALMPNPYPKDIYNKIILDRAVRTLSGSFADTLKEKILKKEKIGND